MKLLSRTLALGLFATTLVAGAATRAEALELDLKLGPAINASNSVTQFGLEFEVSYPIIKNGSIFFAPMFGFGDNVTNIGLPIGFKYDIEIPGVKSFFIYPRFALGYAVGLPSGFDSRHFFLLDFGFGLKYVIKSRFVVGFEPFRLPIGIGSSPGFGVSGTSIQYRMYFYGGVNF